MSGRRSHAAACQQRQRRRAAIEAERIVHNPLTGGLHWDADGLGGVGPVRFANIGAGTAVLNFDFFIY